jgi:methylenetetrahydrofolate reductase (NADPH)
VDLVTRIKREVGLEAMAHLTCVGATQKEIAQVLDQLRSAGIDNVLPLRGDPPKGASQFEKTEGGFAHASELVAFVQERYSFCLAAACYPETHVEAPSAEVDLENLKKKVSAGVDFLITQLFFDNADYYRFVDKLVKMGIELPVIAGIMPVTGLNQVKRFTKLCGSKIPASLLERLEATGGDPERVSAIGVEHATAQCKDLIEHGVPGIHFYTLNRSPATKQILSALR